MSQFLQFVAAPALTQAEASRLTLETAVAAWRSASPPDRPALGFRSKGRPAIDHDAYLSALEPWAALPPEDARRLGEAVEVRDFGAGALLFDAGEMPHGVFVIWDGRVRVTDEEDTLLAEAGPGNAVGGRRLLRGEPNPIRARAITDSTLLVVPADLFRDLAARHAAIRDFFRSGPTRQNRPVGLHAMAVSELMTRDPITLPPGPRWPRRRAGCATPRSRRFS